MTECKFYEIGACLKGSCPMGYPTCCRECDLEGVCMEVACDREGEEVK